MARNIRISIIASDFLRQDVVSTRKMVNNVLRALLCLGFASMVLGTSTAQGKVWHTVDPAGDDAAKPDKDKPPVLRTIGEALRRAKPGEGIAIRLGRYKEDVVITCADFRISGADWVGSSIIEGTITIRAPRVNITLLTVVSPKRGIVLAKGAEGFSIERSRIMITGEKGVGIDVLKSSAPL